MTPKQRILAGLTGKEFDRMPWSPFLAYWWDVQSPERQAAGQLKYIESIGGDPMLRGFDSPFSVRFIGTEITTASRGDSRFDTFKTPVGSLVAEYRLSRGGNTWFLTGHPISEAEDLKVLQWMYEHVELSFKPSFDDFVSDVGENGLLVGLLGTESKTCFQSMVEKWCGIQNLTYLLADEPEAVEECLAAMRRVSDRTAEYAAMSKGESFLFWEDSSTTSISPDMFVKYTAPEVRAWTETLHDAGKLMIHHACGHLRALLGHMADTGIDAIESISPPTTGNIDIDEAYTLIPDNVALVGGIEPVFFAKCTAEELEARVNSLIDTARGKRYVLANSDSCPPEVEEWKMSFVTECVRRRSGG